MVLPVIDEVDALEQRLRAVLPPTWTLEQRTWRPSGPAGPAASRPYLGAWIARGCSAHPGPVTSRSAPRSSCTSSATGVARDRVKTSWPSGSASRSVGQDPAVIAIGNDRFTWATLPGRPPPAPISPPPSPGRGDRRDSRRRRPRQVHFMDLARPRSRWHRGHRRRTRHGHGRAAPDEASERHSRAGAALRRAGRRARCQRSLRRGELRGAEGAPGLLGGGARRAGRRRRDVPRARRDASRAGALVQLDGARPVHAHARRRHRRLALASSRPRRWSPSSAGSPRRRSSWSRAAGRTLWLAPGRPRRWTGATG